MKSKTKRLSIGKIGRETQISDGSRIATLKGFSSFQKKRPVMFPSDLKHLDVDGRGIGVAVFEIPAGVYPVVWQVYDGEADLFKEKTFKISLPYIVLSIGFYRYGLNYYIETETVNCWFSNKELRSLDEKLCFPHLKNCTNRGGLPWICLGLEGGVGCKDLEAFLQKAYNECRSKLFGATFNDDIHSFFDSAPDKRVRSIENWQKNSEKDPKFATKVKWRQSSLSLAQALEKTKAVVLDGIFDNGDYDDDYEDHSSFNEAANVVFQKGK